MFDITTDILPVSSLAEKDLYLDELLPQCQRRAGNLKPPEKNTPVISDLLKWHTMPSM